MPREDGYKNLNPVRSEDEARSKGQKGGIASGETRRRKKAEKDYIKMLLDLPIAKETTKEKLEELGVSSEYFTNEMLIAFKLFNLAAIDGDLNAIKYIDERTGNNPLVKIKQGELNLRKQEYKLKEKLTEKDNPNKSEQTNNGYTFIPSHSIGKSYVDIYRDILNRRHRFYNFKGGRGSLKSSFCSLVLNTIVKNPLKISLLLYV